MPGLFEGPVFLAIKMLKIFTQNGAKNLNSVNGKIYNEIAPTPVISVEKPLHKLLTMPKQPYII